MQKIKSIFKTRFSYNSLTPKDIKNQNISHDRNKMMQQFCRETRIITQCSQTGW